MMMNPCLEKARIVRTFDYALIPVGAD